MEQKVAFGLRKTALSLQSYYNVSPVVDCKFCDRTNMFLRSALLKFTSNHEFLFAVLLHVLAVMRMLERTLEEVDVKMI